MNATDIPFTQKDKGFMTYPVNRWHKAMFKWPVNLWRLGLAPVIGQQMMLITHTGRKTGLFRRTMTECYRLDARKYAPCAFGRRAQWYLNIEADPRVTIQTADGVESAVAVRVTDGEELLALFDAVSGRAGFVLDSYLGALQIQADPEDILAKRDRIYWFRFDPTDETTPPALEQDLVWVWPLAVVSFLLGWLIGRKTR